MNISFSHPTLAELSIVIALLQEENLDLRQLVPTAHESYDSLGKQKVSALWDESLHALATKTNASVLAAIKKQSQGILMYLEDFPGEHVSIADPFCMKEKEHNIETSRESQLDHMIVAKHGEEIVAAGRLLDVEGHWEIVSLITKKEYRKQGLATRIIRELLKQTSIRPLFSFQELHLVDFYLRVYANEGAYIPAFEELPPPLQRDLFYMNAFWGPNAIIKIPGIASKVL